MTVGERIKQRREELGMSQTELADLIGLKGKSSISKVEKSGDDVTLKNVDRYAQALKVSRTYLMGWTEKDSTNPIGEEILRNYQGSVIFEEYERMMRTRELSHDEIDLVDGYRAADDTVRTIMLNAARVALKKNAGKSSHSAHEETA